MICLARQVGTLGPSLGHSGTKPWASTDQATGIRCPWGGHIVPKRWAIFGHYSFTLRLLINMTPNRDIKKGLLPKQKTLLFFATCRNEVLQGKTKLLVDELFAVLDNKTLSIACHFLTEKVECSTLVSCLRSIDV